METEQTKPRDSKFSFSKPIPMESSPKTDVPKSNLLKLKQQIRVQINNLIENKVVQHDELNPMEKSMKIADKLNVQLEENDFQIIKFSLDEYQQNYRELGILGEGCIGLVKAVERKSDKQQFAVKIVKTNDEEIIKNMIIEFKNLQKLIHENIVRMREIYINYLNGFQEMSTVFIIMDKVDGKEMFEAIQELGHYDGKQVKNKNILYFQENMARQIFKQILEALKFMHINYCCHRDLKPNNILCSDDGQLVKITDFNVSKFSDNYKEFSDLQAQGRVEMWTYTGTVAFSAPEIFSGTIYNEMVDMWSAGCVLYTMLSGQLPFVSDFLNDLIEKIVKGEYDFKQELWKYVSDDAKDLISRLLKVDVASRIKPEEALSHPWIQGKVPSRGNICREVLRNNRRKLVSAKYSIGDDHNKMRARFHLFGAGQVWQRHSLSHSTKDEFFETFRKFRSFDLPLDAFTKKNIQNTIQVQKQEGTNHVYKIEMPDFSDSSDDELKEENKQRR